MGSISISYHSTSSLYRTHHSVLRFASLSFPVFHPLPLPPPPVSFRSCRFRFFAFRQTQTLCINQYPKRVEFWDLDDDGDDGDGVGGVGGGRRVNASCAACGGGFRLFVCLSALDLVAYWSIQIKKKEKENQT